MSLGKKIAFLGSGNMAEALIKGLVRARVVDPVEVICSDTREMRGAELTTRYGVRFSGSNRTAAAEASIVILSVKPQILSTVLNEISAEITERKLLISIAAGVPVAAIERKLIPAARVIRTMPNVPALVGAGATAIVRGSHATEEDMAQARTLFEASGRAVIVEESLLDAVTGLSGSGPAYVFVVIEALSDAGVKLGLPRAVAQELAAQTVLGSAQLVLETGEHPGKLKDQVTSPGGTTIAGLYKIEAGRLRATLMEAVEAASQQAEELGRRFLDKNRGD
jgi:pyrroline-5-carboxylate reductase